MSLTSVQLRNTAVPPDTRFVLEHALTAARKRLRTRRLFKVALVSAPVLVLACVLWVTVVRYTFVEVPPWGVLAFPALWLLALVIVRGITNVPIGEAARYLDSSLGLDERTSTSVEMIRSGAVRRLRGGREVPEGLLGDTAHHLNLSIDLLPSPWRFGARRWQLYLPLALVVLMLASILLPTPLDAIRAQRAEMKAMARAELDRVAQFKAQIVERPGMSETSKERLLDELGRLEAAINAAGASRSDLLAALNDAQERLQALSPGALSEFDGLLAAARTVQLATVNAIRNASPENVVDWAWNPADYPNLSDLAKAADAADLLSNRAGSLSSRQVTATAPRLERASTQVASTDAELGQELLDSANAINVKDAERAANSLKSVSGRFRASDERYHVSSAIEQMMAGLDTGRQKLAETGPSTQKRNQVGFRRPGGAPSGPGPTATGDGGTGSDSVPDSGSVSMDDPSALGPKMGSNSPSYQGQPTGGPGGAPASGVSGSGGSGSQGTQPGQDGAGGSPGGTAGGGQGDDRGTISGQVSGPVGGAGGAISQVPNPAGQGTGSPQSAGQPNGSAEQDSETLYLPQDELAAGDTGAHTSSNNTARPQNNGIQGRVSGAGDGPLAEGSTGPGSRVQVRVPYREVLGQYSEQATKALDQVYIPSDAKEYVKQYFTELGK